ncbi:MAG: rRNA maturation RNase YbeY, partial [Hyphomicrobiaceae bacterium]
NATYRDKDKATNVLSFPAPATADAGSSRPIGDVILSFETVVAEAEERGMNPVDHLQHLVVHGVLHLLGYDHAGGSEAALMEGLESRLMLSLGLSDPYVDD